MSQARTASRALIERWGRLHALRTILERRLPSRTFGALAQLLLVTPDATELKGLCSNIMKSLAAQLRGEIAFVAEGGMTTRVVFPAAA